MVKKIEPEQRLAVFEAGSALPETVEFFSRFRCRLHCASMFTDPILEGRSEGLDENELAARLTAALRIPAGTRFDICLLWDLPNYLDDSLLRAFDRAMRPFIRSGTRAHAFTLRTLETSLVNQRYGVEQAHMFRIRPTRHAQKRCYPKTQATLVNLLPSFDVNQGMLLPDGRLEVLLTANFETA
ncbi:MAG: hypothetical protein PVF89_07610 [Lysobacterales bacterium]